jgi:hypothetical protein
MLGTTGIAMKGSGRMGRERRVQSKSGSRKVIK